MCRRFFIRSAQRLRDATRSGLSGDAGDRTGNVKLPQHGALLFLMSLHAGKDVHQNTDGDYGIGPLVQHDAFGALAHGGVGNFRARRHAFFLQCLQDLRGPDYGDVGSLANPKDLLLDLCEALIAAFHREIAAGDHDAERTRSHRGEYEIGQIGEALAGFNLEDEPEMLAAELFQAFKKLADVGLRSYERITDHVGVLDDELQSFQIFGGQRRNIDVRLREVNSLFCSKLFAFRTCLGDFDGRGIRVHGAKNTADLAVVEPDRLDGFRMIENL